MEEFFTAYQHTFTALGALGTVAAVVTSLTLAILALRADRTRLKAYADDGVYSSDQHQHGFTRCLRVTITNEGKFPFRLRDNCFYWKMPFSRSRVWMSAAYRMSDLERKWQDEDERYPLWEAEKERYPLRVAPRTSEHIWVSYWGEFQQMVERMRKAPTFVDRIRFRFIKAFVRTDAGETFRVKLAPEVRGVLSGEEERRR